MLSSVNITESFTALLEHAILGGFSSDKTGISYTINLLTSATKIRPTKPRFHVLEPRSFRVSAIFDTVYKMPFLATKVAFYCYSN